MGAGFDSLPNRGWCPTRFIPHSENFASVVQRIRRETTDFEIGVQFPTGALAPRSWRCYNRVMEQTYEYTVQIKVRVDAFSEDDAEDLITDIFGVGSDCGANVVEFKVVNVDTK
jgi:hypothetical protein